MATRKQEARAIKGMPKWQKEMVQESDSLAQQKSDIPVRKVPKGWIKEHASRSIQLPSAFIAAGDAMREAQSEIGASFLTKEAMLDLGIWPLMSVPGTDGSKGSVNGEQMGGFDEKRAEKAIESYNDRRPVPMKRNALNIIKERNGY